MLPSTAEMAVKSVYLYRNALSGMNILPILEESIGSFQFKEDEVDECEYNRDF